MAKLRRFFAGRGEVLSVAALGERMLERLHAGAPAPPAHLAGAAADAALRSASAGAVAPVIVNAVLSAMWRRSVGLVAAAVGLVLTLGAGGAAAYLAPRGAAAPAQTVAPLPPLAKSPLRVGIFISAASALPRPPRDNAWFAQFRIAEELQGESDMELLPIIEPGTAEQPQQKRLMAHYFPGKAALDVLDTAALHTLDVIVVSSAHTPLVPAMESIEQVVKDGTPLFVRRCFGNCKPVAQLPVAWRLRGLAKQADNVGAVGSPTEWVVVGPHPILGSLTPTSLAQPIKRRVAGDWGTLQPGSIPLIRLAHPELLKRKAPDGTRPPTDTAGDVVYISGLGKGRIVSCNFWAETPPEIQEATHNRFTARAVKWLADRPLD
jgi:hypothetical protein